MSGRGRAAAAAGLVLGLLVAGCAPERDPWDATDQARLDELVADGWLAGTAVEDEPSEDGLWRRPVVARYTEVGPGLPAWQVAAAEVADAEGAGWAVAFVRCVVPDGPVVVDLWRELSDGTRATARISTRREDVVVSAAATHHLDRATVVDPEPVDPQVCLTEPAGPLETRWSGRPVMLISSAGPRSAGW